MKNIKFFLTAILLTTLAVGNAWGETYSMTPDNATTGNNATSYVTTMYSFTYNNIGWSINQWNPKSLQVKTNQASASNEFRFYNTSAFPGKITSVVVKFSALTLSSTNPTGFKFIGGTSTQTGTSGGTDATWNDATKTLTWTPAGNTNYTYFAMYQNGKVATGTNNLATADAIVVTYETTPSTKTVYLNLTDLPGWENDNACFNVWDGSANRTFSKIAADCRDHIYSAEVTADFNATLYFKRNASNCSDQWNQVSGIFTSVNNMMTVTGWGSDGNSIGSMGAYTPHYGVTFNKNGHGDADPASQCVASGGKATDPNFSNRLNWTFGGWYENAECTGSAWVFNTNTVSAAKTLYAKWTAAGTKTIYLQTDWSSNDWQASNAVIFVHAWLGSQFEDIKMVPLNACQPNILKADIPANASKVKFVRDPNGTVNIDWDGKWNATDELDVTAGKDCYKITNWNAGTLDNNAFTENKYSISFFANGGSGSISSISSITCGTNQTLPSNTSITRDGYDFTGWNTEAGGTGTAYADGATITVSESLNLYAQWQERQQYTITFNDRGNASYATKQGYAGEHITAPADPTGVCTVPTNYIFDGWSETSVTTANATSYTKVNFSTYTISGNATLYAVYKWADAGGGTSLTKMKTGDVLSNGDKIVVVASGEYNTVAMYQETISSSYVDKYTFDGDASTVSADIKNWFGVVAVEGGFRLGDATNGWLNMSNNNLYVDANTSTWTLNDLGDGTFNLQSGGRNLSYRHDLTSKYWRMGGTNFGTSGQTILDIYKLSTGSTYYTTAPTCGAYISVTENREVYVTGGNAGGARKKVQVQDTIFYTSGSLLPDGTGNHPRIYSNATDIKNISDGTQNTNFEVVYLGDSVRSETDGKFAITGKIIVKYTPSANGVNENVRVYLHATYNTGASAPIDSFDIHARALPAQFVIAAKTGGKWYALNGNMSGSQAQPANAQLIVDNDANPTSATYAPDVAVYTFDGMPNTGDLRNARFIGSTSKYLWAASSGNTGIQNNASGTPAGTGDELYDWLLKSDDNVTYTFNNIGNTRDLGLHNTNIAFGMYATGSTYEIRILPITAQCAYNPKPEQVSLSARTSTTATISVKTDATATKYQISTDNGSNWVDASTTTSGALTLINITGLSSNTSYTYSIRGVHGTGTICSDTAKIKFTTATCDAAPTISYATDGLTISANCGTVTLGATGVAANSSCAITQYGFQLATNSTFTQNVQEIACSLEGTTLAAEGNINKGGVYYARIYAINEVDTGFSVNYASETLSGLPNLRIFTRDDATTAPMINGKAELRVGAATNSPAAVTWTVKNPGGTDNATMAATLASKGMFSATSMGVYTVTATQAANADPVYCGQTVTTYIEVRKPHYYAHVTNCAALNNNDIEVLSISENELNLEFDDADMVQIEIVKENMGGDGTGGNIAEDLFFSKYYESKGDSKLLGVFNGTDHKISLANISIVNPSSGGSFSLASFGHTEAGYILPGEELLFMHEGDGDVDACAKAESSFKDWYTSHTNGNDIYLNGNKVATVTGYHSTLQFSGKGSIYLKRNDSIIDLLGATASRSAAYPKIGTTTFATSPDGTPAWGDATSFNCSEGDDLYTDEVETNYGLSMNRCLLVRKNTVVSGANAVSQNASRMLTLCTEWMGHQLSKKVADEGVQASCDGMAYVGSFNYAEYFNRFDPVTQKLNVTLDMTHNADGSWTLTTDAFAGTDWEGKNFHDLSCTNVQIKGYKGGSVSTTLNYKVPIIVDKTTTTTDATLFGFDGEGRVICPDCDVVIRDNKQLEVVTGGYNDVRDIFVYSGSALNVPTDRPYTARKLTIESENNAVGYTLISNGKLVAEDGIVHTKRIDAIAWYDFSLPYSCKVADIVRTNGKTIGEYGTDWVIMYYDGQKRANTGTPNGAAPTNWVSLPVSATLEAGVGYIVGLGGSHEDNPEYKVRFVLPNKAAQPYVEDGEGDSRDKAVKGYTGAAALRLPCHQGWNYIGSPYVSQFKGEEQDPGWQGSGLLLNGYYTDGLMGNTYDVETYTDLYLAIDEGSGGATDWVQYQASEATLPPFRAFFVQAVSDGNVNFQKAARALPAASAPMRRSENVEPVSEMRLVVSSDTYGSDKTTVKLHSSYTDAYDLGYDMARMLNNVKRPQPFTLNATDYLIYNAANRTTAETSDIPLGVKISATGEYTFAIDMLKAMDNYSAIYLIDKDENNLQFDLLQGNYTTRIASGMCTNRFGIRLVAKEKVTTDIDAQDGEQVANIYRDGESIIIENLPVDATVRVVDAIGRVLHMQKAEGQQLRFVSPIRGAYVIQVISENTNYSVKVVL